MNDLQQAGLILSQCEIMGAGNPAEGFFIATVCQQTGQSYQEWSETYNLIHGRPSMKADAMLARFNSLGGEHEIMSRTPDLVAIKLTYKGKTTDFSLSWEESKEEPFPYRGKESVQIEELTKPFEQRNLKDKYRTPRARMQMMWARLVSDSVRAVCPKANKGSYTGEEVADFTGHAEQPAQAAAPVAVDLNAIPTQATPQTAVNMVPATLEADPTPFDEVDYTVCPAMNTTFDGQPWSAIPVDQLGLALKMTDPALTQNHKNEIQKVINNA